MTKESKILIGVLVGVVVVMVGLFALANQGSEDKKSTAVGDKTKVVRDTSHKTSSGPVQFVEFGDYQCPACGAAEPAIEQILKDDGAKVTFYFRNFPLVNSHQNANAAANAAESAAAQGKFWEMHDKLYATQKTWQTISDPTDTFVGYAKELGLDEGKFKTALTDKKFQNVIDQDAADAEALGVNSTPTFFINGVKYNGKSDYASLIAAINAAGGQSSAAPSATPEVTPAP